MTGSTGEAVALRPLWALTMGAAAAAATTVSSTWQTPPWLAISLGLFGAGCLFVAARSEGRNAVLIWFAAGLALAGGHGLHQGADRRRLHDLIVSDQPVAVRTRMVVSEGWARGRWGRRTRVRVLGMEHASEALPSPSRCRLEIRGEFGPDDLPAPGDVVRALVAVRGSARSPLLVASSIRLVERTGARSPLPALRDRLASRLVKAAGTDPERIRAAELAAALSLGRRDLIPPDRRDGWRRSGFAHVLAVSGLHVGLVGGTVWLAMVLSGAAPTTTRWVLLAVLPTYAVLAGASPSAVRAALMGSIYLGARLLGRALVPMAAVLLTAALLLIFDPSLIADVAFQLTVVLTAALVRWTPGLVALLPLPRWAAAVLAVPIIAQLAAAPLVAQHFSTAVPGAAAANLLVPWLLAPLVLTSVVAAAVAPVTSTVAGWALEIVHLGSVALWEAGRPGRWAELIPPPIPPVFLVVLGILGLASLLPGRRARFGAAVYLLGLCGACVWWLAVPPPTSDAVELLPVAHGLSVRVSSPSGHALVDGGAFRRETAALLAASRIRRLSTVIATHGDEDHTGGLETVLRTIPVETLVLPVWMRGSTDAVPLLRAARRRGTRILPVARGSRVGVGAGALEVLWPPADLRPETGNEGSLVARLILDGPPILVTADTGREAERILAASSDLTADVLIVPHHGSRSSSGPGFLDAVSPKLALIPAGPENRHNHPHPEVITRLESRGITYRMPIRDGRCGVRLVDGEWVLYP